MAITGEFLADFDSFLTAVNESEGRLGALERKSDAVGQAVDRMTTAFPGSPAVTKLDQVAGATGKIAPETDRASGAMGLLNTRIGEIAAGFTLGKLFESAASMAINFGKETIAAAGQIDDMSKKFGLSSTAVQEFKYIADATGGSLGTLAGAAREIAINVAEGDRSAAGALKRLGLNIDELRGKSPDALFFAVSEALVDVKDQGEQAALAMEIGGRKMAESLGAVNAGAQKLREEAPVMQKDVVKAIDGMSDSFGLWVAQQKVDIQNTLGLWAVLKEEGPRATLKAYEEMQAGTKPVMDAMQKQVQDVTGFEQAHTRALEDKTLKTGAYEAANRDLTASALESIETNKEVKAHEEAVARVRESLYSTGIIDRALLYVDALGGVENAALLTKGKQEELNDVVMKAIEAYSALGTTVPAEMLKVAAATREGVDPLLDTMLGLIPVTQSFSDTSSKAWDTFKAKVVDTSAVIQQTMAEATAQAALDAEAMAAAFVENFQEIDAAAQTTKGEIEAVAQVATNSRAQIEAVFNMPNVNPITGAGMMGTDSRVTTRMMAGYTLDEALSLTQGTGYGIMGPRGTHTASGYMYGIQTDIFAQDYFNARGSTTVNVNVGGSVIAERDLVNSIQRGMVTSAMSNGTRLPGRT